MKLFRNSRVLVSALDWGLGHASRSSALVSVLLSRGCSVVLAGSGRSFTLLKNDFPQLEAIDLPSFSPRLSVSRWQWFTLGLQVPNFLWCIRRERKAMDDIVRRHNIDVIISDNRYGVRSDLCPSFFITHQINVFASRHAPQFINAVVSRCLQSFMRKFTAVLVPDVRLGYLSGALSWPVPPDLRVHCIGVLSRLSFVEAQPADPRVAWLGVASGPEPQRSIFVGKLRREFSGLGGRRVIVCGQPEKDLMRSTDEGIEMLSSAGARQLKSLFLAADNIICRSGYSTVLDLAAMGAMGKARFIPTPGQAEQEYLADLHNAKDNLLRETQKLEQ